MGSGRVFRIQTTVPTSIPFSSKLFYNGAYIIGSKRAEIDSIEY